MAVRGEGSFLRRVYHTNWVKGLVRQVGDAVKGNILRVVELTNLRETIAVKFSRWLSETVSLRETLVVWGKRMLGIGETIAFVHTPKYILKLVQLVGDGFSFVENIVTFISQFTRPVLVETLAFGETLLTTIYTFLRTNLVEGFFFLEPIVLTVYQYLSLALSETIGLLEGVVTTIRQWLSRTLQETVTFSESVVSNIVSAGTPYAYSAAYDQNGNPISGANLSVLWDNNTGTAYSIYFSPPAPSNPRRVVLGFNEGKSLMSVKVYISGYTTGKSLSVTLVDSFGMSEPYSISPTVAGWYEVTIQYVSIANVKEIRLEPDTSFMGYISLAEVTYTTAGGSPSYVG